jgi:hypothetical protein
MFACLDQNSSIRFSIVNPIRDSFLVVKGTPKQDVHIIDLKPD